MRILVLGNFSGRHDDERAAESDASESRPLAVDIDNFDRVFTRMAPRLRLTSRAAAGGTEIAFAGLDDFHPDRLYRTQAVFQALSETRRQLQDPATFGQAAQGLRLPAPGTPLAANVEAPEADAATLERLLGRSAPAEHSPEARSSPPQDAAQALIRAAVAPYVQPDAPPHQTEYLAAIDAAAGEAMRAILHHPEFQALESLWRGVRVLVENLALDETLQVWLLDITRTELRAALEAARDGVAPDVLREVVDPGGGAPDAASWSLLVGAYSFGSSEDDALLLAQIGALAFEAGAPFLGAAEANTVGCQSLAETPDPDDWESIDAETRQGWHSLRTGPHAAWLCLALPRVLLRLPYGNATDPAEAFEFEEFVGRSRHEEYLWGSPAVFCALLLGRAYVARGWQMEPGDELEIDDLPGHIVDRDGERCLQACAEAFLGERALHEMLSRGLTPLGSYRNRNAVRVVRFQSIADPPAPLAGVWS